jgi:hypothetical protein
MYLVLKFMRVQLQNAIPQQRPLDVFRLSVDDVSRQQGDQIGRKSGWLFTQDSFLKNNKSFF